MGNWCAKRIGRQPFSGWLSLDVLRSDPKTTLREVDGLRQRARELNLDSTSWPVSWIPEARAHLLVETGRFSEATADFEWALRVTRQYRMRLDVHPVVAGLLATTAKLDMYNTFENVARPSNVAAERVKARISEAVEATQRALGPGSAMERMIHDELVCCQMLSLQTSLSS